MLRLFAEGGGGGGKGKGKGIRAGIKSLASRFGKAIGMGKTKKRP